MTLIEIRDVTMKAEEYEGTNPKFKSGDNSKCVVCGVVLDCGTFGKVCMKCHDEMIKRTV